MAIKVGINGFGRIGRMVLRAAQTRGDIEVVHINDLTDAATLAHLLRYDSVHGRFAGQVEVGDNALHVDGRQVRVSAVPSPAEIPWQASGAEIVFECTGIFRQRDQVEAHLKAGARKVLISAPAKGEDLTVVQGVNSDRLAAGHQIVSNGSCTTNCLAPVAKVLDEAFGIRRGFMTTIHAYTNDQRILDLPHKDLRRARAAGMSMIPTSTGAATAIGLVLPNLQGKLAGMAMRVPTANVSVVDLTVEVGEKTTIEEVNRRLRDAAAGPLQGVLAYSDEPLVSIDYNGTTASSTVDSLSTDVMDGNLVKVLAWYDNECGFSHRMLDVATLMART